MVAQERQERDEPFNLSIDEVRSIVKYRTLAAHQRKGVLQALELIRPGAAPALRTKTSPR